MATIPNLTVEQLAQAFKELPIKEKAKLFKLLPKEWFDIKEYTLAKQQKQALERAELKEIEGKSIFQPWSEVEFYVRNRNNA